MEKMNIILTENINVVDYSHSLLLSVDYLHALLSSVDYSHVLSSVDYIYVLLLSVDYLHSLLSLLLPDSRCCIITYRY